MKNTNQHNNETAAVKKSFLGAPVKRMIFALVLTGTFAIGAHAQIDPGSIWHTPQISRAFTQFGAAFAERQHSPYAASAVIDISPDFNNGMTTLPAVPAGNRLVVDSVSFCIEPITPGGLAFGIVDVVTGGTPVSFYVALNKLVDTTNNTETWIGNFAPSLYADPGTSVSLVVYRDALGVQSSGKYALSGHYVPVR
jgi:hypothetical protein